MAISDNQKLDYLWKKLGYGVSKTDTNANKNATNESQASPLLLRSDKVLKQADQIPATIPSSSAGVVTIYDDSGNGQATVEATGDITSATNRTWFTNLTDWIPPEFGSTYQVKVYIDSTGAAAPQTTGTQIFAAGSGNDDQWFFDYQSGLLHFIGDNLPNGIAGNKIFVAGARYTGAFGTGGSSVIDDDSDTYVEVEQTADDDTIRFYNAGVETARISDIGIFSSLTTNALKLPAGTVAQRPTPTTGMIRFNSDTSEFEGYDGTAWSGLGGGEIYYQDAAPTGLGASSAGVLWFDTGTTGELYVWTGTEFISTLGDSQATFVRKRFTADGNTNTFNTGGTASTAPPFVYLNGVLIRVTDDYTYSNGVVTFINTPPNLSVIEVVETGDADFINLSLLNIPNHNLITVDASGNVTISGTLGVTGETTMGSAIVSDLTEDRVVLAGVNGALEDSANLTFGIVGATATVAGTQATPSVNSGDEFSINGTTVTLTGTTTVTGTQTNPTVTAGDQLSINTVQVTLTGTATVTGSTATPTVTAADEFSINGTTITLTGTDLASVISDITTAAISGISAANNGSDQLQITGTNVNVVLADVTNTPLADLGLTAGTTTATGNLTSVISNITGASIPNVTATNVANQLVLTGANINIVVANVTNTPLTDLGLTAGTTAPVGDLTSVISDITTASVTSVVASDNGSSQLQLVGTDVDIVLADVTNTPLASLGLTAGTTTRTGGTDTLTVTGNTTVTGDITIGGNIVLGDADTDSITVTADFSSHLIPDQDVTYDLGSSTKAWRDLYVGGSSIYLGTLILKDDGSGNLLVVNSSNQPVNITGAEITGTKLDIDNIQIDANAITSTDTDGNITITPNGAGEVVVSTLTVSDLTDNRIPLAGTNGAMEDDANFTFDGTTFTVGLTTVDQATGNTTVGGTLDVTGITNINDTTGSTSSTTGALIVDGGVGVAENLYVAGSLDVLGNTTIGDTNSDTLTVTAKVDSALIPNTPATYDLGSSGDTWNNLYLGGNLTAPNLFTIDPVTVSSSTTNYTVTVASGTLYGGGTGNVFYLENTTAGTSSTSNPVLTLYRGNTYVFDVSDNSNNNHPLRFTADNGTTEYTDGVTASGTEGQASATVTFVVPSDAPAELNYYCTVHGTGMGNEVITRNLAGTVIIAGDLQIDGSQTVINTSTLTVDDLNITIADGAANAAAANGAGITVDGANATLTYLSATDSWDFNKQPSYNGNNLLATTDGIFKTFAVTDTDTIYNYTVTGNFSAANSTDTVTFVSGSGLDIDIDTTQKAIRVEHADTSTVTNVSTGNNNNTFLQELVVNFDTFGHVTGFTPTMGTVNIQNNYGILAVSDTDSGYTWAATGSITAAQEQDTLTFISGDAIDIDADAASYAIRVTHGDTSSITDQTAATNTFLTAQTYDTYGHVQTNTFGGIDFNVAGNYAFGEIAVSGQTTVTPNTNTQTLTLVNGTGITITTDNTAKEITVTNSDLGSSQDIIKSIIAVDTDTGLSFAATGTYTVSGNTDSLTFYGDTAIDVDIDTTNGALRIKHDVTGANTTIASATNTFVDAVTVDAQGHVTAVAATAVDFNVSDNYAFKTVTAGATNLVADSNTDTLIVSAAQTSSTDGIVITGDASTDTLSIAHADTSSVTDLTGTSNTFITGQTYDTMGHVLTRTTGTVNFNTADNYAFKTVVAGGTNLEADSNTDTLTISAAQTDSTDGIVITGTAGTDTLTIAHADTSTVTNLSVTTNTFVDEVTFDTFGHVTALGTGTIDFNVADNYAFKTITDGTNNAIADSNTDTFKLRAGDQIEVTVTNDDATHGDNVLFGHADSGVSAGSAGSATEIPVVTVDAQGHVTALSTATPLIFKTFAVNGTNLEADSATDTLTITQGSGITLTGTAGTDTMDIAHADTSSVSDLSVDNSGNTFVQDYAITFDTFGHVQTVSQTSASVDFNVADNYAFKTITDGSNNAVADSNTDTFKLRAGDQIEVTVTNDDATHGDNVLFGHADSGVTANTYGGSGNLLSVTVDAQGHVTAMSNVALNTDFTISDGSSTQTISLGDTLVQQAGTGMQVVVSATDTVTFTNTDRGSQQNIMKSFEVIDSDPGGTSFAETGTISASSNTDTIKLLGGTNIDLDIDTTNKIIRFDSSGAASDVFKTITVTDTNTGYTWSETGNAVASGTTDTLTLVSGAGIDLDVDTSNNAILVQLTGAGSAFTQYNFTGDGSNTTFNTGSTNIVDVQVYVNGVLVKGSGTDYTFTNATGVLSMTVAPLNGDEVTIVGYQSAADPVTLQQLSIQNHNLVTVDNSGNVTISGNLTVTGSQSSGSSQTLSDPIITLGGANPPTTDDNNDRGVVFRWHDGTANTTAGGFATGVEYEIITTGTTDFTLIGAADSNPGTVFTATGAGSGTGTALATSAQKLGFFGFDDTDQFFQFIPDSSASGNVYSGTLGDAKFGGVKSGNIQIGVTGDNEIDTSSGNLTIDSAGGTTTIDDNASVSGTFAVTGGNSTFTGHLLPSADVTYDLGSSSAKWRDLYLSGSSIELGGASITASGSAVVLPAGSTIAGAGTIFDTSTSDTDDLSEGSTNLYYTDTRVQTYLGGGTATNISISGNLTVDGNTILGDANTDTIAMNARISGTNALRFDGSSAGGSSTVFAITNPTANRTITFKNATGTVAFTSDIPTDNSSLTNGSNYITLTNLSVSSASASGGGSLTYNNANGTFTFTPPDFSAKIELTDLSVTTAAAGTAGLSYNNANGTFTFTPPDLSSYLTAESDTLNTVTGRGASTSNGISVGSLNTHTIPSGTGTLALTSDIPTNNNQLTNGANYITLGSISVGANASASGSGGIAYANGTGVFTYTPPDLSSFLTSYTETDTLNSVTGRGATTTNGITVGSLNSHTIPGGSGTLALTSDLSSFITLTSLSVSTAANSGSGSLSYNNSNGTFTFTPPDLSSYLTSESDTLSSVTGRGAATTNDITVGVLRAKDNATAGTVRFGDGTTHSITRSTNDLTIAQTADAGSLILNSAGDVTINIDQDNDNTGKKFQVLTNGSTNLVTVKDDGTVGIGTDNPGGKLTSYTSATRFQSLQGAAADLEIVSDNNTNPVALIKGTGTADLLNVLDGTTEVFTIVNGGNVGIGTDDPTAGTSSNTKLNVQNGWTRTGNVTHLHGDGSKSTTSTTVISGLLKASYRTIKYMISLTRGSEYQASEVLIVHNDTDAWATVYGTVYTGAGPLASFDAAISGTNVQLLATMTSSTQTSYKFQVMAIDT